MADKEFYQFKDETGDKKYFTMVPNYILNHSTATDQAVYLQIKRHAGENGRCFVSKRKLSKKLGIGRQTLKKSINYLLVRKWISENGSIEVDTPGGKQKVTAYVVNDIWKTNIDHYKPPVDNSSKGGSDKHHPSSRWVSDGSQGGSETAPKKNRYKEEGKNFSNFRGRAVDNLPSYYTKRFSSNDGFSDLRDTRR